MKKPMLYILSGALVLSLALNTFQFIASRNHAAENDAILADLQGQIETTAKNLSDTKANLTTLEENHATLLAATAALQVEVDATNQSAPTVETIATGDAEKQITPPATSKPDTKPVNPPATKPTEPSKPVTPPENNNGGGGGGADPFGPGNPFEDGVDSPVITDDSML